MRLRSLVSLGVVASAVAGLVGLACGSGDFDPQSKVTSVRMFGVRADTPYAKPGDTVTLEVLATDGRRVKPRPLKLFWIPVVCANPRDDLYYLCFLPPDADAGAVDGGARLVPALPPDGGAPDGGSGLGAGGLAGIPLGVDLGPFLPQGTTFRFRMPDDVIQPRRGSPPYGLAVVFNIACAGQVRLVERTGQNPQQVPIQCTDEEGVPLSPDDYVIGINRIYAYADRTNTNPVVEQVTLDGAQVNLAEGIVLDRCVARRTEDCPAVKLDVKVSEASWEDNPGDGRAAGQREQIWVSYYSDVGTFEDDARLLFDSKKGRVSESAVELRAPKEPGQGQIWAVVHDNRAGAAFVVLPLRVR